MLVVGWSEVLRVNKRRGQMFELMYTRGTLDPNAKKAGAPGWRAPSSALLLTLANAAVIERASRAVVPESVRSVTDHPRANPSCAFRQCTFTAWDCVPRDTTEGATS